MLVPYLRKFDQIIYLDIVLTIIVQYPTSFYNSIKIFILSMCDQISQREIC